MARMNGWTIRTEAGEFVDTVFYAEDCDEQYVRAAEDIPPSFSVEVD